MKIPVYLYFIALSFLASLTVYIRPVAKEFYLKLFTPFLFCTLCAEAWGSYLSDEGKNNVFIYNFFTIVEFCFYMLVLSLIISKEHVKKIIRISILLFIFASAVNIFFIQGTKLFHTNTYSIGCLLIVSFCIYYFLELFRAPKAIKLTSNPAFWISSSLLFFYICSFPAYALFSFGGSLPRMIVEKLPNIFAVLNIFLYLLFTISFLCVRNLRFISSRR